MERDPRVPSSDPLDVTPWDAEPTPPSARRLAMRAWWPLAATIAWVVVLGAVALLLRA